MYALPLEIVKLVIDVADEPTKVMLYHTARSFRDIVTTLPSRDDSLESATREGYLNVLKWMVTNGCIMSKTTLIEASLHGHLDVVKWLMNDCRLIVSMRRPRIAAAKSGHVHVLEYLGDFFHYRVHETICLKAARHGHLPVIEWVLSRHDLQFDTIRESRIAAAKGCHLNVLKWFDERFPYNANERSICMKAARYGHLSVLKHYKSFVQECDAGICAKVAKGGHEDVFWWLLTKCPTPEYNKELFIAACAGGCLKIVKWLREEKGVGKTDGGRPFPDWGKKASSRAALGGHLDVLKYLWEEGCPHDCRTGMNAVQSGNIEMIWWILEKDQDSNPIWWLGAARNGQIEIYEWLLNICFVPGGGIIHDIAREGHISFFKWVIKRRCYRERKQIFNKGTCSAAAEGGHLKLLRLLRENGCPWDAYTYCIAKEEGHVKVVEWLRANGCPRK